ncbi:VC0807 family protein [Williamsia sp.]|uniref:VC0807 family protein n=1 Tax=Williamsia sp. TaxID=1872085 RepID=UPI001A34BC91|nr:VC0807 family protein [Williamsia sp.]MBJ7289921.1 hypothetical protein [Williamsia sp.]
MWRNVIATLTLDVALPLAAYFALTASGMAPVWALLCAAAVSVVVLLARWTRSRSISTLGALVLVRFALGVLVAVITGDARFVLAKDYLVTFGIAIFAAVSLNFERPFIARIRRDLSGDRNGFDLRWEASKPFRDEHRLLTWLWVAGLVIEVAIAVAVIYTAPLDVAVVVTNVLSPVTIITLIAVTQFRGHRAARAAEPLVFLG